MLSFKLNEEFVAQYVGKQVPWGYTDAGGNSVGELTFLRTYSRLKEDGSKETWVDVCRRVIEGMFSIQKDHCKTNRIPWNGQQAAATAKEGFDRLFNLKWTPPGRGMWVMGTPHVHAKANSASLQNCFGPTTSVLTEQGPMSLAELEGLDVELYTRGGWKKGSVKSFGEQPVQRVTFAPFNRSSNHRVVETVTPDHRWELSDGSTTTSLKVGDVVPASVVDPEYDDPSGYLHGLIFADGSVNYRYKNGDFSHSMRLCGDKARHVGLFDNVHYQPNCNGDPVVYHRSATNLKELPSDCTSEYAASFIRGWLEFDGCNGALSTQNALAVEWLKENAAFGGYGILGINYNNRDTNYGKRSAPLAKITLTTSPDYWTVKAIEPLDEPMEVFCPVVPGVERFTLSSGVYTSNCSFISTSDMSAADPSFPFRFLMDASMMGIGVGFDTKGADKNFEVHQPTEELVTFVVPDDREGWVESIGVAINQFLKPNSQPVVFDYSLVRPFGSPIKGFGGTSSGPDPLRLLHELINTTFKGRTDTLTSTDIVDIMNMIGVAVVAGNARRSAELALGSHEDPYFLDLKNSKVFPERNAWPTGWGHMSNNSISAVVGMDYSKYVDRIADNGEPGFVWLDVLRNNGRLIDGVNPSDYRVVGVNPCGEQGLESGECCTLVESYITRHDTLADYLRTLKFAYLYAKTVTLLPTHWEATNAIMMRNRRIGTSVSGLAAFADTRGLPELQRWMDAGYKELRKWDKVYSEWMCVRESVKVSTVKPSGSVSILAGSTPGVHWPVGGEYVLRSIRFSAHDAMVPLFIGAGYLVEPDVTAPDGTVVVYFPIKSVAVRPENEVSLFEKAHLAVMAQTWWSDNAVSVTLSFNKEKETKDVAKVLAMYEGQMKSVSFLPQGNTVYQQQPYTKITEAQYIQWTSELKPIDLSKVYAGGAMEAVGEAFCANDTCELPVRQ